ncbi:MAG: carboxylesterase/lipase family protein [Anaerovibrio sp.]
MKNKRFSKLAAIMLTVNIFYATSYTADAQAADSISATQPAVISSQKINTAAPAPRIAASAIIDEQQLSILAGPDIATVTTEAGKLQGYINRGIYTYHGVPYAEATERFTPAKPVKHWDGIRLAFDYGAISPQAESEFPNTTWEEPARRFKMDNNCQNLNIWTPGIMDNQKRPVMIWLHGGGFESGSSAETPIYDGGNLSRYGDVVVVSINHRLNSLGHLDLSAYNEKYKYSANVGIYDVIQGLQWIQKNIRQFGGNPDNVTIFGESGGGAKVLTLMASPYAKNLFHKGIVESGAVETMGPYLNSRETSRRVTELTLQKLGVPPDDIEKLQTIPYNELRKASAEALQQTGDEFKIPRALGTGFGMSWEPVVDGDFLPTNPVTGNSFAAAGRNIPLLIGSNLTEWTNFAEIVNMQDTQFSNKHTWSDDQINQKLNEAYGNKADAIVAAFQKAYPDKTKTDALYIDTIIRLPLLKIMSHKADQGGAPVYSYLFSWDYPMMNGVYMSFHTAEIPFVFHNIDKAENRIGASPSAKKLEQLMSETWINFARTGKPGAAGLPSWEPYTRTNGAVMLFDHQSRLVYHHDKELMALLAPEYQY